MRVRSTPAGFWEVTGCSELAHQGFSQVSAKASAHDNYGIIACVWLCVYLNRTFLSSFLRSTLSHSAVSEASGAICQFFACVCVCVCVCVCLKLQKEWVYYANERKDEEKKQRVVVSRRRGSGIEMILCVCVCVCVCVLQSIFVCLSICPRAAQSAINLTSSWQHECLVVWHSVCELESGWYHQFLYWKHTGKLEPFKCYMASWKEQQLNYTLNTLQPCWSF